MAHHDIADRENLGADVADPRSPLMASTSRLKIAPFGFSNNRGLTPTFGEGSIAELDWAQQVRIAQAAERAGFEAVIAGQRWKGYKGPTEWTRYSYEGIPWAAGIGAATSRISVFSTVHVPLVHPVRLAKELATVDHITGGRCALNIVSGWNVDEFAMFDIVQHEHDDRYAAAAEWTTLLKQLWTSAEEFDFKGEYYRTTAAYSSPFPIQRRPPIMSAGSSPAGRHFAATHADLCFAAAPDLDGLREASADIKRRASELGRTVEVWTTATVLCGETEADVQRQYDYYVREHGDWETAANSLRDLLKGGSQSMPPDRIHTMQEGRIFGSFDHGLKGTPEQVVAAMVELNEVGIDGIAGIWFDYERGIEAFRELIHPLAVDAGVRSPLVD